MLLEDDYIFSIFLHNHIASWNIIELNKILLINLYTNVNIIKPVDCVNELTIKTECLRNILSLDSHSTPTL